jgi:hypothetical protein
VWGDCNAWTLISEIGAAASPCREDLRDVQPTAGNGMSGSTPMPTLSELTNRRGEHNVHSEADYSETYDQSPNVSTFASAKWVFDLYLPSWADTGLGSTGIHYPTPVHSIPASRVLHRPVRRIINSATRSRSTPATTRPSLPSRKIALRVLHLPPTTYTASAPETRRGRACSPTRPHPYLRHSHLPAQYRLLHPHT